MRGRPRQIAVVAAALVNVALNALAATGRLFGTRTGDVSDTVPTGVTPAGWAFSIWSVIFAGVLIFAGYQALPRARVARFDALGAPFILANLLCGLWQIPWLTRRFGIAAVVIAGILMSLIWLYRRLDRMGLSTAERWVLGVPTSIFLAWLIVATPLNLTIALVAAGIEESPAWPTLLILLVAAIGVAMLTRTGDVAFACVLTWAYVAIYAANVRSPASEPLLAAALGLGVLAFVVSVVIALRRGHSPLPTSG